MAATTLTDRAVVRLSGRGRARFPPGAGHQRRHRRAAGLGGAAHPAGQMPVRLPRLGGWRRPAARLRGRCGRRPGQAALALPAAAHDPIARDPSLAVHWLATASAAPDPRLPRSAGAGSRRPAEPASGLARAPAPPRRLRGPAELGDLLWLECNAAELNGVSFTKGCFVGQENTARMNWRQKVNRRLVVVEGPEATGRASAIALRTRSASCRTSPCRRSRWHRSSRSGLEDALAPQPP